jgi:uncharacterized protein
MAEQIRDVAERSGGTGQASRLKVIDCDVHPVVDGGLASVYQYMPVAWRERFKRKRAEAPTTNLPLKYMHPNGGVIRADARTPEGKLGGSDPRFVVTDLIEPNGIDAVLLNCTQTSALAATLATTDESIVLCSAFNDFFADKWLPVDQRLRYAMCVPSQDPLAAAEEIRRFGRHSQVAAIHLPVINVLLGNRYFWPIYAAAQEVGLPLMMHVSGTDSIFHGPPMSAGGIPDSYIERYVTLTQGGESNVNSLVFSGTLEKFPALKFLFVEYGFLWILPLMLRMDRTWRQLRHETPWVKQSPIDTVRQRIRFTTQPIDEPNDPEDMARLVRMIGAECLCFSTDYPHWDNDMPGQTLRMLSDVERRAIFYQNAAGTLRLEG